MDGLPIGRKVDVSNHNSYKSLALTLEEMFDEHNAPVSTKSEYFLLLILDELRFWMKQNSTTHLRVSSSLSTRETSSYCFCSGGFWAGDWGVWRGDRRVGVVVVVGVTAVVGGLGEVVVVVVMGWMGGLKRREIIMRRAFWLFCIKKNTFN